KSFETYLYRVSKMLITAGVIAYLTGNIIEYYDYTHSYLANFGWNYNQSVELLQRTYLDNYISYVSILSKYLYENGFNPLDNGQCPVYFLPQVFKNYTDLFVRYGLMRPNDWQYRNGTLVYPYLYNGCDWIFTVLKNSDIFKADTLIHIFYPKLIGAKLARAQTNFVFLPAGSWLPSIISPAVLTMYVFYMLFVAIW
ncbi:MAG: hypothetical protein KBB83_06355, partial [Alphaproteobacteria bacterium]|nr:hypothetical protein [Alphaproteobacteria bacterium]